MTSLAPPHYSSQASLPGAADPVTWTNNTPLPRRCEHAAVSDEGGVYANLQARSLARGDTVPAGPCVGEYDGRQSKASCMHELAVRIALFIHAFHLRMGTRLLLVLFACTLFAVPFSVMQHSQCDSLVAPHARRVWGRLPSAGMMLPDISGDAPYHSLESALTRRRYIYKVRNYQPQAHCLSASAVVPAAQNAVHFASDRRGSGATHAVYNPPRDITKLSLPEQPTVSSCIASPARADMMYSPITHHDPSIAKLDEVPDMPAGTISASRQGQCFPLAYPPRAPSLTHGFLHFVSSTRLFLCMGVRRPRFFRIPFVFGLDKVQATMRSAAPTYVLA